MLSLTFEFPSRPSHARDDTFVPLLHAPTPVPYTGKESGPLPGERDLDLEDYNYNRDAGNKGPANNPFAAQAAESGESGFHGLYSWIQHSTVEALKELLRKLLIRAVEEVPGVTPDVGSSGGELFCYIPCYAAL